MTVCFFGIYDPAYSRNRVLIEGFRLNGYAVVECRADPRVHRGLAKYLELYRQWRRVRSQEFDVVLVAFPGQTVVWLAWLLFSKAIIFDAFLSLYDSNVLDRKAHGLLRGALDWFWDYSSCALAQTVLLDTQEHSSYFARTFGVPRAKMMRVWVGSDPEVFAPRAAAAEVDVHFHGTDIPLQGIQYIIEAARLLLPDGVHFRLVGIKGAAAPASALSNITLVPHVPYAQLPGLVASSRLCLGIFGDTAKTARVIPNKVYECMAMGKAVITADTPAVRELGAYGEMPLALVPAADAGALAAAIRGLLHDSARREQLGVKAGEFFTQHFTPQVLVADLLARLPNKATLHSEV